MRTHEWLSELETWLSVQADQLEQSRPGGNDHSPEAAALGLVLAARAVTIAVMDTVRRRGLPDLGHPPTDEEVEAKAKEIYLALYGTRGARWEALETKDVWREKAREKLAGGIIS